MACLLALSRPAVISPYTFSSLLARISETLEQLVPRLAISVFASGRSSSFGSPVSVLTLHYTGVEALKSRHKQYLPYL